MHALRTILLAFALSMVVALASAATSEASCTSSGSCRNLDHDFNASLPGWAIAIAVIIPLLILGVIISVISCFCCACCVGCREAMRNHHEVEMVGTTVYAPHPGQVYYGPPRNDFHAVAPIHVVAPIASPLYGAPPAFNMNVHVAAQPVSQAHLYVPVTYPVDEDSFY